MAAGFLNAHHRVTLFLLNQQAPLLGLFIVLVSNDIYDNEGKVWQAQRKVHVAKLVKPKPSSM